VWRRILSPNEVNLWRMPLFLSLVAILLFGITAGADALNAQGIIHLPAWISNGGIDDARSILSSEMGAVSTVLALIFSVALLVLSMVATLFGFRLLYRFVQDWVTQVTIGLFLATFIYILLAYVATRSDSQGVFIPQLTLLTASVLVVVSFGFLVYYSHRIAVSIQNPDMIAGIVVDMAKALKYQHKFSRGSVNTLAINSGQELNANCEAGLLHSKRSGYIQELDQPALVAAATGANAEIVLAFRPGQFIQTGEVLAKVYPLTTASKLLEPITNAIRIGSHRVLSQDPEFGLYQIVEIAIRALSPAVNDTFTGVACIDCIGDALRILLTSTPYDNHWYDKSGHLRITEPQLKFERLVKVAFDQIRQASVDTPAVLIRMLSTIERLAPLLRNDAERNAMLDQAAAIWEAAATGRLVTHDRSDLENAWLRASTALGGSNAKISELHRERRP
jgi:uncharacterized membrane protein